MARLSAGLLVYRRTVPAGVAGRARAGPLEVLIVHPGGPFWARRDEAAWSLPKGEHQVDEDPLEAARREFREELGHDPPAGAPVDLGEARQAGGKTVHAWALEGDLDVSRVVSNRFEMEWPPRSGRVASFPEVDRAEWVSPGEAARRLVPAQRVFLERLRRALQGGVPGGGVPGGGVPGGGVPGGGVPEGDDQ